MARARQGSTRALPTSISIRAGGRVGVHIEGLDDHASRAVRPILPLAEPSSRADVTIRFVDGLKANGERLWPLPAGPTPDGLWVADHLGRAAAIPIGHLDTRAVVVDRHIDPAFFHTWVWLPVLRMALWRVGGTLVHASGFVLQGRRVVVAAWGGTGKTAVLLECLAAGADFLGDDWVALFADGTVAPVSAQLNLNPAHGSVLHRAAWPGSRAAAVTRRAMRAAARATARSPRLSTACARIHDLADGMGRVKVPVHDLFPAAALVEAGPLDTLVLLTREGCDPPDAEHAAAAVAAMTDVELAHVDQLVAAHRHAHPRAPGGGALPTPPEQRRLLESALGAADLVVLLVEGGPGGARRVGQWLVERSGSAVETRSGPGSVANAPPAFRASREVA